MTLSPIERPAHQAEQRLRLRRAILWAAKALAGGLVAVAVLLVLRKTGIVSEKVCRIGVALATLQVFVAASIAYARKLPRRAGAVALDRFHGLADRLSSALSFGELRAEERTPFMMAAIDDALEHVKGLSPAKAVPMQRPRELPFLLAMVGACVVISLFEVRKHQPVLTAKTIDAVDVTQDDLDAMREFLKEIDQKLQSDEAKAATQEFNQLLEDLANKRLDRTEAFRRMQQLEDKLLEGNEADKKALEDAMKEMGDDLKKSELSKPTGEAFSDQKLSDANKALKDLAKELRDAKANNKGVSKEQLDKLREALKKASEEQSKRQEALDKRRDELKEDLLKQKQKQPDGGAPSEEEKSLLQKKERELERLDREKEQQTNTQRQLDRLDRELQKAAEDLMKDLGLSADDLDQAAEDINRMEKQEMTQDEKEQLRQKLQELREMMRQQAQGGQGQMQRLRVFQKHAQGGGGQSGPKGQGQQGQGNQGNGNEGSEQQGQGQQGQGQQGQGGQQGGQQGQGGSQAQGGQQGGGGQAGGGQGETWILGPNGEKLLMLSKGQGSGGQGQGQGQGGNGGEGKNPGGQGYGTGHDEHVQGAATNGKYGTQDSQIQGNDTGQGGSRSEVILGAAERGFASRGYQRVYREYHNVAEEALNKDEIPGGYRFYVRRYFQLIRPREEGGGNGGAAPAPQAPPTNP